MFTRISGALRAHLQQVITQDLGGLCKHFLGSRHLCHQVLGHAYSLCTLAGEEGCYIGLVRGEVRVLGTFARVRFSSEKRIAFR